MWPLFSQLQDPVLTASLHDTLRVLPECEILYKYWTSGSKLINCPFPGYVPAPLIKHPRIAISLFLGITAFSFQQLLVGIITLLSYYSQHGMDGLYNHFDLIIALQQCKWGASPEGSKENFCIFLQKRVLTLNRDGRGQTTFSVRLKWFR